MFSCKKKPSEPDENSIQLFVEDVGVTDATFDVHFNGVNKPRSFFLKRNGTEILTITNAPNDTLVIDEQLQPKQSYTYKASTVIEGQTISTKELQITTMDTTSHNFTWHIDTLGDGASSVLNDVAIVNENDVWAVGEIEVHDSSGGWRNPPYNIAHWNGVQWELRTLKFKFDFGENYATAEAIFAFDSNNIVVSSGGCVMKWNGQVWTNLDYLYHGENGIGNVYTIWGTSSNDFYGGGLNGSIVHWDGSH